MSEIQNVPLRSVLLPPISGSRPAGGVSSDTEGVPSVGGENILASGGMTYEELKRIPSWFFKFMPKGKLQRDDVLINKDGAQTGKVGFYDGVFEEAAVNEHVFILRSRDPNTLDQRYLYYSVLLPETRNKIERRITGSAQPGLNSQFVSAVDIPLQPLSKQRKIATILSSIDTAIEKTEALISKYQLIKAGLMHDLFTRGVLPNGQLRPPREQAPEMYQEMAIGWIPREWEVSSLNSKVNPDRPIAYGILMPGYGYPGGVPVVKVKDIRDREIDIDGLLLTSPAIDHEYRRSRLRAGDILFTIRGTVGRVALVPKELEGANITQDTARIDLRDVDNRFVSLYFETPRARSFFEINTLGQAVQGINLGELRKLPIPIPILDEQQRISGRIFDALQHLSTEVANKDKLRQQKLGLMQDLLTGKVPVKVGAGGTANG